MSTSTPSESDLDSDTGENLVSEDSELTWEDLLDAWTSKVEPIGPLCRLLSTTCRSNVAEEGQAAWQRAEHGGPLPQKLPDGTYVTAKYWGISHSQLRYIYQVARRDALWDKDDSIHDFVRKFVKPITAGTCRGLSLGMNLNRPLEATVLVSHAWVENATEFFMDVLLSMKNHEVAYICFLANYQGTVQDIEGQIGEDVFRSPFAEVLSCMACKRLLVIPNKALEENGQGLYSRLWCDFEIKMAADAGIPIHIPVRNTVEHLLGRAGNSSQFARCGDPTLPMNKDEMLIRKAIETKPPVEAKTHAYAMYTLTCFTAFTPLIICLKWPTPIAWTCGFVVGMLLGVATNQLFGKIVRPAKVDGYQSLDSVIRGAAMGYYANRRFRALIDFVSFWKWGAVGVILDVGIRAYFLTTDPACLASAIPEGSCAGLVVWLSFNFNSAGPWTGVFILGEGACPAEISYLLSCAIIGKVLNQWFGLDDFQEGSGFLGLYVGLLAGLGGLSAYHHKWRHAASSVFMALLTNSARIFGFNLSYELSIFFLGFFAVELSPDLSRKTMITTTVLQVFGSVVMICLGYLDTALPSVVANSSCIHEP